MQIRGWSEEINVGGEVAEHRLPNYHTSNDFEISEIFGPIAVSYGETMNNCIETIRGRKENFIGGRSDCRELPILEDF